MGKEHHYILMYNEDDGKFYIDYSSCVWGSDGHSVYDTDTNSWHSSLDNPGTQIVDTHLQKVLQTTVDKLNNREAL